MNEKELIISLMKLDKAYIDKAKELTEILGGKCEILEADLFNTIDDDGKRVKDIFDIVLEYAGIPEADFDELENPEGYCRDIAYGIYFSAVMPFREEKMTFEKSAEILISMGNNEGNLLPEYIKYWQLRKKIVEEGDESDAPGKIKLFK